MDERPQADRELRREATEVERSERAVERSASDLAEGADRRTTLASDRTLLAAERTYAAWVRTALAALAAGVGGSALMKDILPDWIGKLTGTVLIVFAGFCSSRRSGESSAAYPPRRTPTSLQSRARYSCR